MVDLPKVSRRLVTTEAPQSGLSARDVAAPYAAFAQAAKDVGDAVESVAEANVEDAAARAVTVDAEGNVNVERTAIPMVGRVGRKYENYIKLAAVARADTEADRDLIELRADSKGDPQAFMVAGTEYRDKRVAALTSTLGPAAGEALRRQIDNRITQSYGSLLNEHQNKTIQRADTDIAYRIKTLEDEAETLAVRNGVGPEFNERVENIRALRQERVGNPHINYPQARADAEMDELQTRLQGAAIREQAVRIAQERGYDAAEAYLTETTRGLQGKIKQVDRIESQVRAHLRVERTRANAEAGTISRHIAAIDDIAADGHGVPAERLAAVQAAVDRSNNPALKAEHDAMLATLPIVKAWRQMSPAQVERELTTLDRTIREQGASERLLALRSSGQKLLDNMRKEVQKDALGWADRVGVAQVPPIDFGSPDAADQMRHRAVIADIVARDYGIQPQYLRPEERRAIEVATSSGAVPMQAAAQMIVNGFGPRSGAVLSEVGQQAPVLAHLGGLLSGGLFGGGDPAFANDVASGTALLRNEETRKQLPAWARTTSNTVARFQTGRKVEQYGDAFLLVPDTARAAEQSAQAAFVSRAQRQNFDPSVADPDTPTRKAYDRALQEGAGATFTADGTQMGGIVQYSTGLFGLGGRVLVPGGVRADRFRDVITKITDEDLTLMPVSPMAADGKPYTARDIHKAVPVAVPGGYRFSMGDPASGDPKWVRGADGQPFVLDFEAMTPKLRGRIPGAFAGGR